MAIRLGPRKAQADLHSLFKYLKKKKVSQNAAF